MGRNVILLNGPSSSGKSTLAETLRVLISEKGPERYEIVSIDDFLKMSPDETIYEDDVFAVSDDMCREALEMMETADGVIIDHVIVSRRIFENLKENLSSCRIKLVRITCSPELLRAREQARGDRSPGSAEASEKYLYPKDGYDLTVDTGMKQPEENAMLIYSRFF